MIVPISPKEVKTALSLKQQSQTIQIINDFLEKGQFTIETTSFKFPLFCRSLSDEILSQFREAGWKISINEITTEEHGDIMKYTFYF